MIMGSDEIEKVEQLQFPESRKKDRAERLGNDIRCPLPDKIDTKKHTKVE